MAATNELRMSYDDMQAELSKLSQCADEYENITSVMTASVNLLCEGWNSASTEAYHRDYTSLASNFQQTLGVVRELIQSTANYIADMQAVDQAYSKSKVSMGS